MNRIILLVILCTCIFFLYARNPLEPTNYAAPARLPNVLPEMNTAGFWIARHPYPDSLIMDAIQISNFNDRVRRQGTHTRIEQHSSMFNGSTVKTQLRKLLRTLSARGKYDGSGAKTSKSQLDSLRHNAAIDKVPSRIKVRFGFPVKLARQRFAPSNVNLNSEVLDIEFDELQNSGYDIGTPTVFFHDSADGLWVYGASANSVGWYLRSEVCFIPQSQWIAYQTAPQKVVCTNSRTDLWSNDKATQYITYCRMGTAFPYLGETGNYYRIQVPYQDSLGVAYLAKEDASFGYLPYTPRNVYKQAFSMLNMPYGWGDTEGDYDCSSLLKGIFATFGFRFPRNGLQQAKAGKTLQDFSGKNSEAERDSIVIRKGLPGLTLLRLNGHIMLYLGHYNDHAYALHDTWGFRRALSDTEDEVFVINKTVVSDLYLSQGSQRGSLLIRLTHLSGIVP